MGYFKHDTRERGRNKEVQTMQKGSLYTAICSTCGKECEVPFRPSGSKPVYCNDCFTIQNASIETQRFGRDSMRKDSFYKKVLYEAICDSCGKRCKIPFQPRNGRPIYCSDCFEKQGDKPRKGENRGNTHSHDELREVTIKLDKILSLLQQKALVPQAAEDTHEPPIKKGEKEVKKTVKKAKKEA